MIPIPGDIVLYRLGENDVAAITARRDAHTANHAIQSGDAAPDASEAGDVFDFEGLQAHECNPVAVGDVLPMVITRV